MALAAARDGTSGRWLALTAALLGWMFDGFEMGLFPVVSRPALKELLALPGIEPTDAAISFWNSLTICTFLVGAATGGVLFGWLGDRIGRVRAMMASILTYALFSGLGGFTAAAWHMVLVRFFAALGMGGEWSLGVALVMEVWQGQSRAFLAGLIGAAANAGYLLVALLSLSLGALRGWLSGLGLSESWVEWRLLMVCGALPALLTFFIRAWVPESENWEKERDRGKTAGWHGTDLLSVAAGVLVCSGLLAFWLLVENTPARLVVLALSVVLVTLCYLYPIYRYLGREAALPGGVVPVVTNPGPGHVATEATGVQVERRPGGATISAPPAGHVPQASGHAPLTRAGILRTMLLGALLSGIPLLATWGSVQWAPTWANQLSPGTAKEYAQMASAFGAILGCIAGAALAGWAGRRIAYVLLCLTSLGSVLWFYQGNTEFGAMFLISLFFTGFFSAAFYGWLPLYLPELFPTRVRATGQGFSFNFGRILAAIGVLQVPVLMGTGANANYPYACSALAFIYLLGVVVIWLAPETQGKPLPE
jgi:SHS family sialic acid transporter-like MFS transporter